MSLFLQAGKNGGELDVTGAGLQAHCGNVQGRSKWARLSSTHQQQRQAGKKAVSRTSLVQACKDGDDLKLRTSIHTSDFAEIK